MVFASDSNLIALSNCSTIYLDGTFKCGPMMYSQLFSVHGNYKGVIVPLVFALLSSKTFATYFELFNVIMFHVVRVGGVFNPTVIMSDFESVLIELVRTQFPNSLHSGYHFHFTQAVWRKVQEIGLSTLYSDPQHAEVTKFIQLCMALLLIPVHEVEHQFNNCVSVLNSTDLQILANFITYFRTTWISNIFPIRMWNQFQHDHQHRTNNQVESWHSSLQNKLPRKPNIYVFVRALKLEEVCRGIEIQKLDAGESPPRRKRKHVNLEERRSKMFAKFVAGEISVEILLNQARHLERRLVK